MVSADTDGFDFLRDAHITPYSNRAERTALKLHTPHSTFHTPLSFPPKIDACPGFSLSHSPKFTVSSHIRLTFLL
jgi:hypothetical protein